MTRQRLRCQARYGTPCRKLFRSELRRPTKPLSSWVSGYSEREAGAADGNQIEAGSYSEGTRDVRNIFGTKAFNHAKPVSLIRELVRQSTGPGDIVLDFFAGSATTAQAVMELNAEDGMDRRFVMVSRTEATDDDQRRNLCRDVTAQRIRKLNASTDPKHNGLVAGFAYLRTERIPIEHVDLALDPAAAWASLEALHGLPPAFMQVDPMKQVQADAAELEAGLTSRRKLVAARGWVIEDLDSELAAERGPANEGQ